MVKWWRCRCPGDWVRAAKLNLQQALNTRIPNAVLNFAFKLRFKQVPAPRDCFPTSLPAADDTTSYCYMFTRLHFIFCCLLPALFSLIVVLLRVVLQLYPPPVATVVFSIICCSPLFIHLCYL